MNRHPAFHTKRTRRALLLQSLGFGSTALLLAACSGVHLPGAVADSRQPTAGAGPTRGGTLRISQLTDIAPSLVPHVLGPQNFVLYPSVYDTLVAYDAQLQVRPRLGTSWQWSSDFRRIALQLRSGVKFHNGKEFTSADAKFNLERLRDAGVGSQWMSYASEMHIETPDPYMLIISYDQPRRSSFDALAGTFMADPWSVGSSTFVGTGPFRVQEWVQGDHLTFVRNPDYWQPGKPYLDHIELFVQPDQQTSLIGLETSTLDWMTGVGGPDARRLQVDPAYQVLLPGSGGNGYYFVGLDTRIHSLADKRVRQAFNHAMNRQRMVDVALAGYGRAASTVWPPQALGYDAAQDQAYAFDPGKARQLLEAA
jgi:peptide/nickel transport system substrate-binding protein